MHFHLCTCNCLKASACSCPTPDRSTLLDMYHWVQAGLEELGHRVTFSHQGLEPTAMNLLWEGFTPEVGEALRASGLRYGIIVTEFMDGSGFNKGTPRSNQADRRDETYRKRWLGFEAAASRARFFWSMVESNIPALRERAPAAFVELGYSDRLVPKQLEEPTIDFSFSGILTPHRQRVLEALEKRARVVWHGMPIPIAERDRLFQATRINLSINKTVDWEMPSGTRVGMALLSRRGIALDLTPQKTRLSSFVEACPQGMGFVDFAIERLNCNWQKTAELAFERYRAELPMKQVMERALDETCRANVQPTKDATHLASKRPLISRLLKRFA